ncbi:cilia- and flagella-associated protein 53 isoform X2 [Cyclopterus lumpus]|uniref:cilia- and flagella-associated protein 53 isoform X2 n=1 Tax=Cyclopterus lumpus TaxID=8103 RepID=UPI0014871D6E|nr:cilia- and flagella-associated protein 53 isoform X2 [Cyclopterus lumpus]
MFINDLVLCPWTLNFLRAPPAVPLRPTRGRTTGEDARGAVVQRDVVVFVVTVSQRRRTCREVTGPTPHAVAVIAKFPSSRPADQLILDHQKQDSIRDQVLVFTKHQQSCDVKTSWLQSSDQRFLRGTVDRQVRAALDQQEVHLDQRRDRLRVLLEVEEQQLLQEMEEKEETSVERQAKMRERAKTLKGERERVRQQLVSEKLDQLFRERCEEVRSVQSRRSQHQVSLERAAQVRSRQQQRQEERQEERQLDELWEADRRAKEEQEAQREEARRRSNREQLDGIQSQMEEVEQQRRELRELKEEEAELRLQQQETLRLQQQRERHQGLQDRRTRRRQLDLSLRLKVQRLCREQQDELQLDINILQTLLQQEVDEKQEAAHRKAERREDQRRYRQHLSDELQQRRREEEEAEQLMEEALKEVWTKREQQSRLQREARNRLMEEVMEARRLQIQHQHLNQQKQTEFSKERDELNKVMEETRLMDEEEKRRLKQTSEAYQSALGAQVQQQQQLRAQQRVQAQKEHQQGLILQDLYDQRKDQILSRPTSHSTAPHPFRRGGGTGSASRHHLT